MSDLNLPPDAVELVFDPHVGWAIACLLFGLLAIVVQLLINLATNTTKDH